MTTTYDPFHPQYFDTDDLREEMDRVFDLCHGCRLCFKFCTSFPTMFEAIDRHDDQDAAKLTDAERHQVVDECFNCKLCYVNCPYVPGQHEWAIDFPRLMLRAEQTYHRTDSRSLRERVTDQALGRTDLAGTVNTKVAALVNPVLTSPGGPARAVLSKVVGIASERVLPPYAKTRFSTWFKRRTGRLGRDRQGAVALFPTCLVEYQDPAIGHDVVKVYERNGIECALPDGQVCCGAPWLHSGDVEHFRNQARTNVRVLAGAIRDMKARGDEPAVVVPQPTCSYVLKHDYTDYLGGPDAELVAAHTYDAAEFLWTHVHKHADRELDTEFTGSIPASITYHAPCHLRAQNIGFKSRDLLKQTGADIKVVAECSGIDGTFGYREENYEISRGVARKMVKAIDAAASEVIAGDCHLANGGIAQETGQRPQHPLQLLARAYGIPEED